MEVAINNFEAGRHHITAEMRQPTCDILFSGDAFDCLVLQFNQLDANQYSHFHTDPIRDFITEYLLAPQQQQQQ